MSRLPDIITDQDICSTYLCDQSGLSGSVAGVVRVRDVEDVVALVRDSARAGRKLLPVGCQTATTGAAVPQDDVVVDLRPLSGLVDVDETRLLAEVLPGTITREFKDEVARSGLYYPPDPTSEWECTIGGNVATNASGARSFRWGMTSRWIAGIEVVLGTGEKRRFMRRPVDKNTAGYRPFLDPVDLFLGSEGTLGIVTRVWCRLIRDPGPAMGCLLFLPDFADALALAVGFRRGDVTPAPRCCELLDRAALDIVGTHSQAPAIPEKAEAALYVEFDRGDTLSADLERAVLPLTAHRVLVDDTVVAESATEREWLRELRHHVPEQCNLEAARYHGDGGLKVSTEFCVPVERLIEMMTFVEKTLAERGAERVVRYGHIGNGHPHIFMRGRNRAEVAACKVLAHRWYDKAVSLGGTVSGEHGIGKTRRDIMKHMYPIEIITAMRAAKRALDPADIFAVGNLFPETEALVPEQF